MLPADATVDELLAHEDANIFSRIPLRQGEQGRGDRLHRAA